MSDRHYHCQGDPRHAAHAQFRAHDHFLYWRGKGHYVGNFLQVYSTYSGWWGEGDTIFHVDGRPITHTPGTEDEYGSCWEFDHTFAYAYSGYLQNDNGHNRMYRWYLANPVRFQKSLKVEIQNQRWYRGRQTPNSDDYTSVAFWY